MPEQRRSAAAPRTPSKLAVRGRSSRAPPRLACAPPQLEVRGAARWPPWPRAEGGGAAEEGERVTRTARARLVEGKRKGGEGES